MVSKQNLVGSDFNTLLPSGYRSNFSAKLADGFTNSSSLRSVYFLGYSRFKQGLRGNQGQAGAGASAPCKTGARFMAEEEG